MERNSAWWKRKKSKERSLLVTLAIIITIGICLAITLGVILCRTDDSTGTDEEICFTPECVHTASKILQWIDPTVDPCEDFYDFACGNFIKSTKIPDDESSVSTSSVIDNLVTKQLRAMIEEPVRPEESKPFILIKKMYKACMNKTQIEEIDLGEIRQMISDFGGWPVLQGAKWKKERFDWKRLIYKFEKAGFYTDYLLSLVVDVDETNSSRRIINIDQPFLVLSREFIIKGMESELVKAYHSYMVDIAVSFGAESSRAYNDMLSVLIFETKLANISIPNEERRDSIAMYNPMTITDLQATYRTIPWLEYINHLLSPYEKVTEDEVVIINALKYLDNFEYLMASTDKRTQANYLIWRAIASVISYLPEKLRNIQLQFSTALTGETEMLPRWKECINHCSLSLDIAADALYVRKYFKVEARNSAWELVSNIRAEFKEMLKDVEWMDEQTKEKALEKVDLMVTHIAYPPELMNNTKLEEFYKGLEVDENSYLRSSLNVSLFASKSSFKKLRQSVNKTEWNTHSSATNVNAFYSPNENSIQFPAGILQGVYFNHDRPNYMNYGGVGYIIGHEITHGFDDDGRNYDIDGNLADWWVPETETAFLKKAQCIISQYGNYTVPEVGQKVNGISTQGENIADNGGVKQAYLAYDRLIQKNGEEPKLPGLDYSGRQLFWISAAHIWCSKTRPEVLKQRLADDFHSPDRFRVIGVFSNMQHFAKDFDCKIDSKMNPKHKCHLW